MQQIADWLEELGMSEHVQCFVDNKIDVSVLQYLTDQDLKEIGIPLGHRRKMLAAIDELSGQTAGAVKEAKGQELAERRDGGPHGWRIVAQPWSRRESGRLGW